ncbi:tubby protein homolog [Bombina bombina]|uniref:tubby protein homolog n=1 Tax=Bombina bombina TaxID=8345 RepID=UPI00235A913A|nr:tubby protein homolog [Bombina bombina]
MSWSEESINFLDTKIYKDGSLLKTDIFRKDTDRNSLLHFSSAHAPALVKSLPYSQMLRVKRIVKDESLALQRLQEMGTRFVQRGYPPDLIQETIDKVVQLPDERAKIGNIHKRKDPDRMVFVSEYSTCSTEIQRIIRKHWYFLRECNPGVPAFRQPPMPAYTRLPSLKDKIVKADVGSKKKSRLGFLTDENKKWHQQTLNKQLELIEKKQKQKRQDGRMVRSTMENRTQIKKIKKMEDKVAVRELTCSNINSAIYNGLDSQSEIDDEPPAGGFQRQIVTMGQSNPNDRQTLFKDKLKLRNGIDSQSAVYNAPPAGGCKDKIVTVGQCNLFDGKLAAGGQPKQSTNLKVTLNENAISRKIYKKNYMDYSNITKTDTRQGAASSLKSNKEKSALKTSAKVNIDTDDLEEFISRPAPKDVTIKCVIKRDKSALELGMFPKYYLHMEKEDSKKIFLLAARKRRKCKTSNYLISMDPTDLSRGGEGYVGKLRSNFTGTSFTAYDNGINPLNTSNVQLSKIRQELAAITYETNVLGFLGPRKMTVTIPEMNSNGERISIKSQNEQESLLSLKKAGNPTVVQLESKKPIFNTETMTYELNFNGRDTQKSVKNFQLIHPNYPEDTVMQFSRKDDNKFNLDFKYPLSPFQAFSIALSCLDKKFACE